MVLNVFIPLEQMPRPSLATAVPLRFELLFHVISKESCLRYPKELLVVVLNCSMLWIKITHNCHECVTQEGARGVFLSAFCTQD